MSVTGLAQGDIARMRDQLFFEGPERNRRLSRFWLLLPLSAVIASAGVVSDSTATVIVPLWISSDRIEKATVRQIDVQAVADHWASDADWSVVGVNASGDQVLIEAIGPNPAPDLAVLRRDLDAAGLNGLHVRVSLVTASYKQLPG